MKITKETLKKIIKEEIGKVSESFYDDPYDKRDSLPWSDEATLTGDEEQKVNAILDKLVHMGVEIPDVVGLEPEQLAGVIAHALEKWKRG